METRRLGTDGPEMSVVGYGAWEAGGNHWGANTSESDVVAAIHAGLDAGMSWVDTAEVYGDGVSERIVGRALAGRDDVLVFTKVAPDEGSGVRPAEIARAIDASLQRLGRDHVDLYQVHWPDDDVPLEESWGAMAEVVAAGKARHIGVSNFDRARLVRLVARRGRGVGVRSGTVDRGARPGRRDAADRSEPRSAGGDAGAALGARAAGRDRRDRRQPQRRAHGGQRRGRPDDAGRRRARRAGRAVQPMTVRPRGRLDR